MSSLAELLVHVKGASGTKQIEILPKSYGNTDSNQANMTSDENDDDSTDYDTSDDYDDDEDDMDEDDEDDTNDTSDYDTEDDNENDDIVSSSPLHERAFPLREELKLPKDEQKLLDLLGPMNRRMYFEVALPSGTLIYLYIVILQGQQLLIGRKSTGAIIINEMADFAIFEDTPSGDNDLKTTKGDSKYLVPFLKRVYHEIVSRMSLYDDFKDTASTVEHPVHIAGKKRLATLIHGKFCEYVHGAWTSSTKTFVAITGVGCWTTVHNLSYFHDDYVAEKVGLLDFRLNAPKSEVDVVVATLKSLLIK